MIQIKGGEQSSGLLRYGQMHNNTTSGINIPSWPVLADWIQIRNPLSVRMPSWHSWKISSWYSAKL